MPPKKRTTASVRKATTRKTTAGKTAAKRTVVKKAAPKKAAGKAGKVAPRYRCKACGYIYSPQIGEPRNGIPEGTAFEDLPETYACPLCGMIGKGKVGKWGFEPWIPTRFICRICNYVYDEARGEPQNGIKPGTPFAKLPKNYRCPICGLDAKITKEYGKVGTSSFLPLLE